MNLRVNDFIGGVCSACFSLEPHLDWATSGVFIGNRGIGTHRDTGNVDVGLVSASSRADNVV
jgi:hypothetical protein